MTLYFTRMPSPLGELLLVSDGEALMRMSMPGDKTPQMDSSSSLEKGKQGGWREDAHALREPIAQLRAYFAGERREFDLPLRPAGTEFQRAVWAGLCEIPYGQSISYSELARRIGRPKACRAVGAANGQNPIGIIIPCHRVIGADGTLTGYGGGLPAKRWLLQHEARQLGAAKIFEDSHGSPAVFATSA